MIRVHHLNNSRSQRVLWLLEELALPYEIVQYQRDAKTMLAPESLKRIHPLGKSPVIEDGSRVLAETGAIVDYVIARYGPHLAPDPASDLHWRYVYWLHYAEGSAMPPLLLKLMLHRLGWLGRPARGFVDRQLKLHLDYQEGELATHPWFVGEQFTGAGCDDELPAGGRDFARRIECVATEVMGLSAAHSCASGLSQSAGARWSVCVRLKRAH